MKRVNDWWREECIQYCVCKKNILLFCNSIFPISASVLNILGTGFDVLKVVRIHNRPQL
jgi:hypothetical protein